MVFNFKGLEPSRENDNSEPETVEDIEYLGINFGSYQTSISSSSGLKKTIPTMVGWPKDFIALKFLGKQMAVGDEAFEKRLSLNICHPLKAGVLNNDSKNKEAGTAFLTNILEHAKQGKNFNKIYTVIGTSPKIRPQDKNTIVDIISKETDKVMVASQPFLMAYGLNMLNKVLIVDIGSETTDLCLVNGTLPTEKDQITIDSGTSSIDNLLLSLLKRKHEKAFLNENIVRRIRENHGFVGTATDNIITQLPISAKLEDIDITEELQKACESIIPGILQSIKFLLAILDTDYQLKTRENILLTGGGSLIKGIADHMEKKLQEDLGSTKIITTKDPIAASADGALKLAQELPEEYWNNTMTSSEDQSISKVLSPV